MPRGCALIEGYANNRYREIYTIRCAGSRIISRESLPRDAETCAPRDPELFLSKPDSAPTVLVGWARHFSDQLLFELAFEAKKHLLSTAPWREFCPCTLLPLEVSLPGNDQDSPFDGRGDSLSAQDFYLREDNYLTSLAFEACVSSRSDIIVGPTNVRPVHYFARSIVTHGIESCAKGPPNTAVCGRRDVELSEHGAMLSCRSSKLCPRATHQLPISSLSTSILFMGSCASLRLGNSFVDHAFNLGLSFLTGGGMGKAYVGSFLSSLAHEKASRFFLSALASGIELTRCCALANLAALSEGELPSYFAIGVPTVRLARENYKIEYCGSNNCEIVLDNPSRYVEIIVEDPSLIDSVRRGESICSVTRVADNKSLDTICRIEQSQLDSFAYVRIFVASFPDEFDKIWLAWGSKAQAIVELRSILQKLTFFTRMLEYISANGSKDSIDALNKALSYGEIAVQNISVHKNCDPVTAFKLFGKSKFSCRIEKTAQAAREILIEHVKEQISGAFWPSNLFLQMGEVTGTELSSCPSCGSASLLRRVSIPTLQRERLTIVCPTCLIVSDVPAQSTNEVAISNLRLIDPQTLVGDLEIVTTLSELRIIVGLTTPNGAIQSDPIEFVCGADNQGSLPIRLRCAAPLVQYPHFVKAVAVADDDIYFYSLRFQPISATI